MREVILNRVIPKEMATKFRSIIYPKIEKYCDIKAAANYQEMFMEYHEDVR